VLRASAGPRALSRLTLANSPLYGWIRDLVERDRTSTPIGSRNGSQDRPYCRSYLLASASPPPLPFTARERSTLPTSPAVLRPSAPGPWPQLESTQPAVKFDSNQAGVPPYRSGDPFVRHANIGSASSRRITHALRESQNPFRHAAGDTVARHHRLATEGRSIASATTALLHPESLTDDMTRAWLAGLARTTRIQTLGPGILLGSGTAARQPSRGPRRRLARDCSGGRFVLGLGASIPQVWRQASRHCRSEAAGAAHAAGWSTADRALARQANSSRSR